MKFTLLPFPRVHVVSASEESVPECIMSFCSDVTAIVVAAERAYRLITPSESYDISNCWETEIEFQEVVNKHFEMAQLERKLVL